MQTYAILTLVPLYARCLNLDNAFTPLIFKFLIYKKEKMKLKFNSLLKIINIL